MRQFSNLNCNIFFFGKYTEDTPNLIGQHLKSWLYWKLVNKDLELDVPCKINSLIAINSSACKGRTWIIIVPLSVTIIQYLRSSISLRSSLFTNFKLSTASISSLSLSLTMSNWSNLSLLMSLLFTLKFRS